MVLVSQSSDPLESSPFQTFFENPGAFIKMDDLILKTVGAAEVLVPILFMVALCYNYVNTWIKDGHKGQFYDPAELKRTIVTAIMIPLIPGFLYAIEKIGRITGSFFEMTAKEKSDSIIKLNFRMMEITDTESFWIFDLGQDTIQVFISSLLMYVFVFLIYIVRFAVLLLVGIFIKYLILIAPLAAAFSILPFLKDQMTKLLKVFLNAAFVIVTLNLLDQLFFAGICNYFMDLIVVKGAGLETILLYKIVITSFCFAFLVMYLLSVWLTSKYVGTPGAAAALGMAATAAALIAAGATKMLSKVATKKGGGAGANLGGGTTDSVAKAGAESMIENKGD